METQNSSIKPNAFRRAAVGALLVLSLATLGTLPAAERDKPIPAVSADPRDLPDPSGAAISKDYGPHFDLAAKPGEPTPAEVASQSAHTRNSLNLIWTLIAGFLVFIMQAGFALVETGFTRRKNAAHTMMMNMMVFAIGAIGYFLCGFAFMYGGKGPLDAYGGTRILNGVWSLNGWHLLGTKGFFLNGLFDSQVLAMFLFQVVFMDTAATIPTGSMAERLKFSAFIWMSFFLTMFTYPIVGHWIWGGGWLSQLGEKWGWGHGALDFSGSGVIHMVGGITALVGAHVLGPRIGKFDKNGNPRPIPGQSMPMAITGTFILFFGWLAFNSGSAQASDGIVSVAAANTMLAGAFAAFSAMIYMMYFHAARKPDPGICCNGLLAGLVAATAPCAYISPVAAALIGIVAGVLASVAAEFVERKMKIDDCVGAFAIHGVCGMWGVVALGLFACGTHGAGANGVHLILDGGREYGALGIFPIGAPPGTQWGYTGQLMAQVFYAMVVFIFVFAVEYAFFAYYNKKWGLRASPDDEYQGLDIPETGCPAYADF